MRSQLASLSLEVCSGEQMSLQKTDFDPVKVLGQQQDESSDRAEDVFQIAHVCTKLSAEVCIEVYAKMQRAAHTPNGRKIECRLMNTSHPRQTAYW